MYKKIDFSAIGIGVLRASVLTILCAVIYSLITIFFTLNNTVTSVFIVLATMLSVVYGTIYATLKMGRNGWLVGLLVAAFYMIVLYIISLIFGNEFAIGIKDVVRFILALAAGSFAGMLGVNL